MFGLRQVQVFVLDHGDSVAAAAITAWFQDVLDVPTATEQELTNRTIIASVGPMSKAEEHTHRHRVWYVNGMVRNSAPASKTAFIALLQLHLRVFCEDVRTRPLGVRQLTTLFQGFYDTSQQLPLNVELRRLNLLVGKLLCDPTLVVDQLTIWPEPGNLDTLLRRGWLAVPGAKDEPCYPGLATLVSRYAHNITDLLVGLEHPNVVYKSLPKIKPIPEFPVLDLAPLQARIATALGLTVDRILMFPDMAYTRAKQGAGDTVPHADVVHFVRDTDLLARLYPRRVKTPTECLVCGQREFLRTYTKVTLCRHCLARPMPLYTAWIGLGSYSTKTHALLEFAEGTQEGDYTKLPYKDNVAELPAGSTRKYKWRRGLADPTLPCDLLLFNCKVVHKAPKPKTARGLRISLDVRFALRPETN